MVEWCLVVTTPEEAILCALAREEVIHPESGLATGDSHLKLIPTRYEIPTDSVPLLSVCGTDGSRIFMGGYDGCLYEMSYEGFVRRKQTHFDTQYYKDTDFEHDYGTSDDHYGLIDSISSDISNRGKRVLSAILGPMAPSSNMRARKCRKVNHSAVAPPLVTAVVPGFILRATSAVFGSSATTSGGPIVSLTLDKGRNTLYGLTSKGYIHAYDLSSETKQAYDIPNISNTPAKLACSVDVVKSVRRYLDCVSHGRMNPPSTPADTTVASITFPGGASGAMAGIGGMDGARNILKTADADIMKLKSSLNSSNVKFKSESCIHPVSINIVPESESKFLTLVVVAAGGLRYYLSVIPDTGNNFYGKNTNRPGRRFSLCHIRAPPSFSIGDDVTLDKNLDKPSGSSPSMRGLSGDSKALVSRGLYLSGATMLVVENRNDKSEEKKGDSILSITPDYSRDLALTDSTLSSNVNKSLGTDSASSGIKEIAYQPMIPNNITSPHASILLGGHVWELNARSLLVSESDPILTLFYRSATPTTYSQSENILNPYFPSANKRNTASLQKNVHTHSISALETAATNTKAIQSYSGTLTAFFKALILGKPIQLTGPLAKSFTPHTSNYFISNNFGCHQNGFSFSTSSKGNTAVKPSAGQSPRLPPSLLHPPIVPLSELTIQHLLIDSKLKGIFALNSGGLHYFNQLQPIEKLQSLLLASKASSMGRDESLKMFFKTYGYSEGCSMALSIAICDRSSDILVDRAVQAALSFAFRPTMVRLTQSHMNSSNAAIPSVGITDTVLGYDDYAFKSSSLYDGLLSLTSRLLRPIWCKPAIVVTESKKVSPRNKGARVTYVPAKVELLLDETSLEQIRRPLANLQRLMREKFAPAVLSVPGTHLEDVDMLDLSETSDIITRAITYQTQMINQSSVKDNVPKERDLRNAARLHEDRNIHALYRLLSRTVQLLQLISYLHGAHLTPELPEVEFGLLHGLTYSQLVTLKASQVRIESVLTDIFSRDATLTSFGRDNIGSSTVSTVESENLSALLYRNCYLYFSIGSRLSFLGFKNAYAAMSQPSASRRNELVSNASTYFRQASKYWCNFVHVTGGLSGKFTKTSSPKSAFQHFNDIATDAIENGSPLARAAIVLLELNDVIGIVDICLECSKNFDSSTGSKIRDKEVTEEQVVPMLSWEKSLYHRHFSVDTGAQVSDLTQSRDSDLIAKHTCYALLCYHINKLVEATAQLSQNKPLVERMLSAVISSQNMDFISSMFDYLSASNHVETFLRIDSAALENWLKEHDSESSLLWRYYTIHNIHWMAGEVAWNKGACDENMLLSDRLEFLTRALNSYTIAQRELGADSTLHQRRTDSITSIGSTQSLSQIYAATAPSREDLSRCISQVSEQIDIAKLQSRVLAEILQSQNADKINQDQLSILEMKLVNVSDLYNIFACPLAMYDLCLAIIQTCKYDDEATVLKLWKSIICEEILPCRTESDDVVSFFTQFKENSLLEEEEIVLSSAAVRLVTGETLKCFDDGEWKTGLIARVTGLGRELLREGPQFVFPIQRISDWLESIDRVYCGIPGNEREEWVLKTLIDSGASFSSILQAYDSNLRSLGDSSLRLSQLMNLAIILEMWLDSSLQGLRSGDKLNTSSDLRRYATAILNQIDEYKASLQSFVTTSADDTSNVSEKFNQIEKELRKLL